MASKTPYLSVSSVLYDRPRYMFAVANPNDEKLHRSTLKQIANPQYSKKVLLDLLKHSDAKVRTLAMAALFTREDPTVLPAIVALAGDTARAFDGHPQLSKSWLKATGIGPPKRVQTVGDIAKKMVSFYMKRAGYHYGIRPKTIPGFDDYWNARRARSYCASWFAVRLARARQHTIPTSAPANRVYKIHAVRESIDRLPPDDRTWTLLWLHSEVGSDALVSEKELVEFCKKLGPDKLLLMLQRKIPTKDPDMQPRNNSGNWRYKCMSTFVFRHAGVLLRPEHAEKLLACERWERDYQKHGITDPMITTGWAIGAAHLQPQKAVQILRAAYLRFQGEYDAPKRSHLCVALWRVGGESQAPFLVNWYYQEKPSPGSVPNSRTAFIWAVSQTKEPSGRKMIARIVRDKRFSQIDWQSLEAIVVAVNGWLAKPIVSKNEIRDAWHPFGQGSFYRAQKRAERKYPKETKELLLTLKRWRENVRKSMPQWLPDK